MSVEATTGVEERLRAIAPVLQTEQLEALSDQIKNVSNDSVTTAISEAVKNLGQTDLFTEEDVARVSLANEVADVSNNSRSLVKIADSDGDVKSVRDLAQKYDADALETSLPGDGATVREKAVQLAQDLYIAEPASTVAGLVENDRLPLPNASLKDGVTSFLQVQAPGIDVLRTPVSHTLEKVPTILRNVEPPQREAILDAVNTLRRVNALSPNPEAMVALMKMNKTSSVSIASRPESAFVEESEKAGLNKDTAREIHATATNTAMRHSNMLMSTLSVVRGNGLIIDGRKNAPARQINMQEIINEIGLKQVNFDTLFGGNDESLTEEWGTIYGPAAYFVDLLQYLKSSKKFRFPNKPNVDIDALEYLLRRRPDLEELELTQANTEVPIPHIDLANEVMESFIWNYGDYIQEKVDKPRKTGIKGGNVTSQTGSDLLWRAPNTNIGAYAFLAESVYPLTLPYHQPIDTARAYLNFLQINRAELVDKFRSHHPAEADFKDVSEVRKWHTERLDRLHDAESLNMTEEEYKILTKEGFQSPGYYRFFHKLDDKAIAQQYAIKPVHEHYGYKAREYLDADDGTGLQMVKGQFLRRTGISWVDLVDIIQTKFINPNQLTGKDQRIMDSFQASYRYLQTMAIPGTIAAENNKNIGIALATLAKQSSAESFTDKEIDTWMHDNFYNTGFLVVLEYNDGPFLKFREDQIKGETFYIVATIRKEKVSTFKNPPGKKTKNTGKSGDPSTTPKHGKQPSISHTDPILPSELILRGDGMMVTQERVPWGNVDEKGRLLIFGSNPKGTPISDHAESQTFEIWKGESGGRTRVATVVDTDESKIKILKEYSKGKEDSIVKYSTSSSNGGTADIENVQLKHLNGTPLKLKEWDKLLLFFCLWKKLGWSVAEVDMALSFLQPSKVDDDDDEDDESDDEEDGDASELSTAKISPDTLKQLSIIKSVAQIMSLSIEKTLILWTDLPTLGKKSLYHRTFLQHYTPGAVGVFEPDRNGLVLQKESQQTMSGNALGLNANLELRLQDLDAAVSVAASDELNLSNVSQLYRLAFLSSFLNVSVSQLLRLLEIFSQPLENPASTLSFLKIWKELQQIGFSVQELHFITTAADNQKYGALSVDEIKTAVLGKQLRDRIQTVRQAHQLIAPGQEVTPDMVKSKCYLLFGEEKTDLIMKFLNGEMEYAVEAPSGLILAKFPSSIEQKIKYTKGDGKLKIPGRIQAVGILTSAELSELGKLVDNGDENTPDSKEKWLKATGHLANQPRIFFESDLSGIFSSPALLLKPLVDTQSDSCVTLSEKCAFFLEQLMPYLIRRLSENIVVNLTASFSDLTDENLTSSLLRNINSGPSSENILVQLMEVGNQSETGSEERVWEGYLLAPQTDDYIFHFNCKAKPQGIHINDKKYAFSVSKGNPATIASTDPLNPIRLSSNQLYRLTLYGIATDEIRWQVAGSPREAIPDSALFPDFSQYQLGNLFDRFRRASIVSKRFKLTAEDIIYVAGQSEAFSDFDFGNIGLPQLHRLQSFVEFRNSLPTTGVTPIRNFFNWAGESARAKGNTDDEGEGEISIEADEKALRQVTDPALLPTKISQATGWSVTQIQQILQEADFFDENPGIFATEKYLIRIREMLAFAKHADVDVPSLFQWARPVDREIEKKQKFKEGERKTQSSFEKEFIAYHNIALSIQLAAQSRCSVDSYATALRPVNNRLRENQRDGMVQYLINQDELLMDGIMDADSLFEFFLIDVQMQPIVETSRIRQAISTVQLFVQRCFLSLESKYIPSGILDRGIWDWMKSYSTWAANRKVFLYPENWIEPGLRDDKTPFFKELETELAQKEVTKESIDAVMKGYMCKLAEISNLEPAALYIDVGGSRGTGPMVHFFGRTRNSPFDHYHRTFDVSIKEWTPWIKMVIEIPHYVSGDGRTGSYLVPIKLGSRLLVFIPQILRKTKEPDATSTKIVVPATTIDGYQAKCYYEIKMSWTECRSGIWTPRQVGPYAVDSGEFPNTNNAMENFLFIPTKGKVADGQSIPSSVNIAVWSANKESPEKSPIIGSFQFTGSQLSTTTGGLPANSPPYTVPTHFCTSRNFGSVQNSENSIYPTQTEINAADEVAIYTEITRCFSVLTPNNGVPQLIFPRAGDEQQVSLWLGHEDAQMMMNKAMGEYGTSELLKLMFQKDSEGFYGGLKAQRNELAQPYSLYNWELGLHIPMLLIDRFLQGQQFDQALAVCQYVFDPLAEGESTDKSRFWKFRPFKEIQTRTLERFLLETIGNKPANEIKAVTDWRNKPFLPHLVARSRPEAYMKWIVTKYIEILIAYGDFYFRQNTLDSVPNAVQMYILASHMYGPRGQKIPRRNNSKPMTYKSLEPKLDAFSNAIVAIEETYPFSNQITIAAAKSPSGQVSEGGVPTIFGFATAFYFSIPDNPKIRGLRDTIDDRLFKIRNSQDINGIERKLPLFDPPIDPSLLVKAQAQGLQLSSVLGAINGPMPNYRFQYLLERAIEMASEVRNLGNSLLQAKEKLDGEIAAVLRAKHESTMSSISLDIKKLALRESKMALESLEQSRKAPAYRLKFYLQSLGLDDTKIPDVEAEFQLENFTMEKPVDEGSLKLLPYEKLEMDMYSEAQNAHFVTGIMETASSVLHALPIVATHATPLGCGVAFQWGPPNLAYAAQAVAQGFKISADSLTFQASSAGRKAASMRTMHDRYLQANVAGLELKAVDKQILAARIRVEMAEMDIKNHQKQIEQAAEFEEYLRAKFSSVELYTWMSGAVKSLYYDTYNQAYDMASKAVKVFKYERPRDTTTFLQPSYWDSSRQGLLSGDKLYFALKQLETAYQDNRGHDYEITKHVSLRQLNPLALIKLRETNSCDFDIPEAFFDLDFPGHYLRRIKSVTLSIPCVVGSYTSVSAVLRLTSHRYRIEPTVGGQSYPEKQSSEDPRFTTTRIPISSIATSSGIEDSGMFELAFRDERYLPFEGAGAISSWTLSLEAAVPQFPYRSISDAVIHMRYTAVDGGQGLYKAAKTSITDALDNKNDSCALVDLRNEYASSWETVVRSSKETTERILSLPRMEAAVPFYRRGATALATTVHILSDIALPAATLMGDPNVKVGEKVSEDVTLGVAVGPVPSVPTLTGMSSAGVPMEGTWSVKFPAGVPVAAKRVWMLIVFKTPKSGSS